MALALPIIDSNPPRASSSGTVTTDSMMSGSRNGRRFDGITPSAMELLSSHTWPGNVRELRGVLERALALGGEAVLDTGSFFMRPDDHPGLTLRQLFLSRWPDACRKFQTAYMRDLLKRSNSKVYVAAKLAGVSPRAIYKIMDRLDLRPKGPSRQEKGG